VIQVTLQFVTEKLFAQIIPYSKIMSLEGSDHIGDFFLVDPDHNGHQAGGGV
jgi:hypothetical protein